MESCKMNSKLICSQCKHYDYCDRAKRCDGKCYSCDITDCENNPIGFSFYSCCLFRDVCLAAAPSVKREGLWCGDSRTTMPKSRTCLYQAHATVPNGCNNTPFVAY